MSDTTDRTDAEDKIALYAQTSVYPVLSDDELGSILDQCQRASTWTAETEYGVNDVVMPVIRNGHRYRVIEVSDDDQESDTEEPDWPTGRDDTVTDGGITWKEDGAQYANVYDWQYGVYLAWQVKYAKASGCNVDFKTAAGNSFASSQILTHINQQILRWTPHRV